MFRQVNILQDIREQYLYKGEHKLFETECKDQEVCILKYLGNDYFVEVPEYIDTMKVRSIGNEAFRDCQSLIDIKLPDSLKDIGDYAFC